MQLPPEVTALWLTAGQPLFLKVPSPRLCLQEGGEGGCSGWRALLCLIFPQVSSDYEDGLMFHVFRAEFCRAPFRGRGAPWLAGRGRGMTVCQVTPSTHVCYLSGIIGGMTCWTLSFPHCQLPPNETQCCCCCCCCLVQMTGRRGTLQPGEGFPGLLCYFGRPGSF